MRDGELIDEFRWNFWMHPMPMPPDCTWGEMRAMRRAVDKMEWKETAAVTIKEYESLWKQYLPKYKEAEKYRRDSEESEKEYQSYYEMMKSFKEVILLYREALLE